MTFEPLLSKRLCNRWLSLLPAMGGSEDALGSIGKVIGVLDLVG